MGKKDLNALLNRIKSKKGNNSPDTAVPHGPQKLLGVVLVSGVLFFIYRLFKNKVKNEPTDQK